MAGVPDPLLPPDRPVDAEELLRRPAGAWQRDVPRRWVVAAFAVFALAVGAYAASRPSGYLTGRPGPVYDLSAQLGREGDDGAVLLLTVGYREVSWARLAWHHLTGSDDGVVILGPGHFDAELRQRSVEQMAASRTDAALAAADRLGYPVAVPEIDLDGVGGGSGGLAITLTLLDAAEPGALTGGRTVAVTGTIDDDGVVGPIGGAGYKTTAAIAAGADVVIVPQINVDAARAAAGAVPVVGVGDVDEAVAWLCANGGTSTLC